MSIKVALIILNWNGRHSYLPDLFSSLKQLDFSYCQCDIFFVDNGSSDESLSFAKEHLKEMGRTLYFIEIKTNQGFSTANNLAMERILESNNHYKYVVLLSNDIVVDSNWLKELVKEAERNDTIGAVQSLVMLHSRPDVINSAGLNCHYLGFSWCKNYLKKINKNELKLTDSHIGFAMGGAVLYSCSALRKVGLFDERFFMYYEDLELSWRLRLAGFEITIALTSIVHHKYDAFRYKDKWFLLERNRLFTYFSMYHLKTVILLTPIFILGEIVVLAHSIKSGFFLQKINSYLEILRTVPYILEKHRKVQSLRSVPDKQILTKYMTTKLNFGGRSKIEDFLLTYLVNPFSNWYFKFVMFIL